MRYLEPTNVKEAIQMLESNSEARCISGGATLVAMLNSGLIDPNITLVSLNKIRELNGIAAEQDVVRIGATTTHTDVSEDGRLVGSTAVVKSAASQIAHPDIRNMGTIGGSVCHADPAADLPGALLAADARVEAIGSDGKRLIPAADFFVNYLETSLTSREIVTAIILPRNRPEASGIHLKFSRVHGDYATVSVSLVISVEQETCTYARVAIGAVGPVPLRIDDVDQILIGSKLSDETIAEAGHLLANAADPIDDVRGTSEYRRMLIPRLLARAVFLATKGAV